MQDETREEVTLDAEKEVRRVIAMIVVDNGPRR